MLRDNVPPSHLPGSIYGAVGLCQFMPSNIAVYGADGNGDGRVDLFDTSDAIASLANYLAVTAGNPGCPAPGSTKSSWPTTTLTSTPTPFWLWQIWWNSRRRVKFLFSKILSCGAQAAPT